MKLEIDIPSIIYNDAKENRGYISVGKMEIAWKVIADGKPLEQEPRKDEVILTNKEYRELIANEYDNGYCKGYLVALEEQEPILDKIRAEIEELRKAPLISWASSEMIIDTILEILDKYKAESEGKE